MVLSIIVPVYNMRGEGKLAFCLDSLVNQTISDYEIITVNDASTDDSLELLREYERKYPELIKVIDLPKNHKQGGAKNHGLDMAQGDFVGFVDSDDWVMPNMYEKLLQKAHSTGADVVGCDYCLTYEHSFTVTESMCNSKLDQVGVLDEEKYKSLILDPGSLVIKIYKRELFETPRLRFPEHIFFEDNAIVTSLFLRVKHYEYIPEVLYFYYQHNTSTVHTISEQRCANRLDSMRIMADMVTAEGYLTQYGEEIEFRFFNLFFQNTLFTYMAGVKPIRLGFIKEMGDEMRRRFPNFQKNKYYLQRVNEEERRFIAVQQKSTLAFVCFYRFVYAVRGLKKKLRSVGAKSGGK
ncbi:MAG: glycosyltransferase [Lachnospiraceae bacterium]|nr:glycosyltransferase [Lachnospiraceae bacterium]